MLYPLKFKPLLKSVLWGGDEICAFKGLPAQDGIGESWEISGVPGDVSVVANGELKGRSLDELIAGFGAELLGASVLERFGTTFPLLIKFIDAKQALSIQVHPDDELAGKRHNSFGKTEMWYVVKAAPGASLYSGFSRQMDAEKYLQSLQDDTFVDSLQGYEVQPGDVFFLPAGRVHAIGAGCFIAEIQQTSNITYRIYDYKRTDAQGRPRELHTEWAKDAIDYTLYPDCRSQLPVHCPYFNTELVEGAAGESQIRRHPGVFVIYICLAGKLQVIDNNENKLALQQGESLLVPAVCSERIRLEFEANSRLLETYI
jgi:mannose-6-phosphate isomerase